MQTIDTIKGVCHINLDYYTPTVTRFARVPNIGESVACLYKGKPTHLEIVQIVHDFRDGEPFIIVALDKRNRLAF